MTQKSLNKLLETIASQSEHDRRRLNQAWRQVDELKKEESKLGKYYM